MIVTTYQNAADWLNAVAPVLSHAEAENNLLLGLGARAVEDPSQFSGGLLMAGVADGDSLIGAALSTPPRVLIVSEHASARFGGEAALPLHYFRVLRSRGVPVWLVTHARTRDELQALFPGETRIRYIEDTALARLMWRVGRRLPARVAYLTVGFVSRVATQLAQRRLVRRLVAEHGIDVVHQPMPVSPRTTSKSLSSVI